MKRSLGTLVMGAALGLSACAPMDAVFSRTVGSIANFGGQYGAPWGGVHPASPTAGHTMQRVSARNGSPARVDRLETEPGNVWPAAEGPRATLANPDEALRGIPTYRPGADATTSPAPNAPASNTPASNALPREAAPRRPIRGSGAAFVPPDGWVPPQLPPLSSALSPPLALPTGSVLQAPDGNRIITGGTSRAGSTIGPSGQTGVLLGGPGVRILQEPGLPAQQILTPR